MGWYRNTSIIKWSSSMTLTILSCQSGVFFTEQVELTTKLKDELIQELWIVKHSDGTTSERYLDSIAVRGAK